MVACDELLLSIDFKIKGDIQSPSSYIFPLIILRADTTRIPGVYPLPYAYSPDRLPAVSHKPTKVRAPLSMSSS